MSGNQNSTKNKEKSRINRVTRDGINSGSDKFTRLNFVSDILNQYGINPEKDARKN